MGLALSESVLSLLQKALWWVIRLAPIGTVGLIGSAIATYGWDLIGKYATFTADIYIGCAIVLFGVGLLPLLAVPLAYALTFDDQTLSEEDLERVRRAAAARRGAEIG